MEVSRFEEKLNKVDGNVYVIEEKVILTDGVYKGELKHDNINQTTLAIYTGPRLTGERIQTFALSTPSLTPWKRGIRVFAGVTEVYITYETDGDTVEAEDVNRLQAVVAKTQTAVNTEYERATRAEDIQREELAAEAQRAKDAETEQAERLMEESGRAQEAERTLRNGLAGEIERATEKEVELADGLQEELKRASDAEKILTDNLKKEIDRSVTSEEQLQTGLDAESTRAKTVENNIADNLSLEASRAGEAEKVISDALVVEAGRAKGAEKTLTDNLSTETARAEAAEEELQGILDTHKSAASAEIAALKAKDTELDDSKASVTYVNQELEKRYTKEQVYTKTEVLQKIEDLIATAPDTLDTFKEIADALGNDPNFATTIINSLSGKVDKVAGKQLTSNDYSNEEKAIVADVNNKKHSHSNKGILDSITQAMLDNLGSAFMHITDAAKHVTETERTNWTDAFNKRHEHINKSVLDKFTQTLLDNLNVAYSHISNKSNPHGIEAETIGLDNVENKNGAAIRAEMTKAEVVKALGYTPPTSAPTYTHPDSGIRPGTYRSVTVNAQGHATAGTNPTTLAGYGITDAMPKGPFTWAQMRGAYTWNQLKGV